MGYLTPEQTMERLGDNKDTEVGRHEFLREVYGLTREAIRTAARRMLA